MNKNSLEICEQNEIHKDFLYYNGVLQLSIGLLW